MQPKTLVLAAVAMASAGAVLAHSEVSNPVVKERMELMETIRDSFATVGGMVQGKTDFDAGAAASARESLISAAGRIPAAFEAEEMDPESEARPAIWDNWDDFTDHATALEDAAEALDTQSLDTVKAGFGTIGKSCGGCHEAYREK